MSRILIILLLISTTCFGQGMFSGQNVQDRQFCFEDYIYLNDTIEIQIGEVQIGDQIWMCRNLDIDDGLGGITIYNNDSVNWREFGNLYTWGAAMRLDSAIRNWHVPSNEDWIELREYAGGEYNAGKRLKEAGYKHWQYPNYGASNYYGWSGLGGGNGRIFLEDTIYYILGKWGNWWSSSFNSGYWVWSLYNNTKVSLYSTNIGINNNFCSSIRLIQDSPSDPPVITVLGDNPITTWLDSVYVDPGATALDDRDGDLTSKIVTTSDVNVNIEGTYHVNYYVEDDQGHSDQQQREVNVVQYTEPPSITITYPMDGDTLILSQCYHFTWNTVNGSGFVSFGINQINEGNYEVKYTQYDVEDIGSYNIKINDIPYLIPGDSFIFYIRDAYDGNINDISEYFTIIEDHYEWDITHLEYNTSSGYIDELHDLCFSSDGTKLVALYSLGGLADYSLSVGWDLSTVNYIRHGLSGTYYALDMKSDGTSVIVSEPPYLKQYTLSTSWNMSTAVISYSKNVDLSSVTGIRWGYDGSNIYVLSNNTDRVYQYHLTIPWNLNSWDLNVVSFDILNQTYNPQGLDFGNNENYMYITSGSIVYMYYMSDAGDISTSEFIGQKTLEANSRFEGVFAQDGFNFYLADSYHNNIKKYTIPQPLVECEPEPADTFTTVTIGTQTWMKYNLHIDDGGGGIYDCNNNSDTSAVYGLLYNWNAAMRMDTLIDGWHLPSKTEWQTLSTYLGGNSLAGGKLKEAGYGHWNSPNTNATNATNFTALGSGIISGGSIFYFRTRGQWWSSTLSTTNNYWYGQLLNTSGSFSVSDNGYTNALSVRLIKD